jgi:hypothetical protein
MGLYSVPVQAGGSQVTRLSGSAKWHEQVGGMCSPPLLIAGATMKPMEVMRYLILILSAAAVVFGALVMVGMLVPVSNAFPGNLRIVIGAVIVLYGLYHFLLSYYRRSRP